MEVLKNEMISARNNELRPTIRTPPPLPQIHLTADTPSKKRKMGEEQQQPSYAGMASAMHGVKPLDAQQQRGVKMLQNI